MESIDIFRLRGYCGRRKILLCFNGPISQRFIEETGNALRDIMNAYNAPHSKVMDVFGVFIEMTQNVCHYSLARQHGTDSPVTLIVARGQDGRYLVEVCNLMETSEGEALVRRVENIAKMDKPRLEEVYRARLRPTRGNDSGETGLGLIDMARKSSELLRACLQPMSATRSLFSLRVVI